MKKMLKWIAISLAVVMFALALWMGWFIYVTEYRITDIDTDISPDGQYALQFQAVGEPDFPFGDSHARIVLKRGNTILAKTGTLDVANDGGTLAKGNWDTEWKDDRAIVTLHGEEQPDAFVVLYFDGSIE